MGMGRDIEDSSVLQYLPFAASSTVGRVIAVVILSRGDLRIGDAVENGSPISFDLKFVVQDRYCNLVEYRIDACASRQGSIVEIGEDRS